MGFYMGIDELQRLFVRGRWPVDEIGRNSTALSLGMIVQHPQIPVLQLFYKALLPCDNSDGSIG